MTLLEDWLTYRSNRSQDTSRPPADPAARRRPPRRGQSPVRHQQTQSRQIRRLRRVHRHPRSRLPLGGRHQPHINQRNPATVHHPHRPGTRRYPPRTCRLQRCPPLQRNTAQPQTDHSRPRIDREKRNLQQAPAPTTHRRRQAIPHQSTQTQTHQSRPPPTEMNRTGFHREWVVCVVTGFLGVV